MARVGAPVFQVPQFEAPKPPPPPVRPAFQYNNQVSQFDVPGANPVALQTPRPPPTREAIVAELEKWNGDPRLQPLPESRRAEREQCIAEIRDDIVRKFSPYVTPHIKDNGNMSLDAFDFHAPDGVHVIDFARASKDLDGKSEMQFLDVTNGGASAADEFGMNLWLDEAFKNLINAWSVKKGAKGGSSPAERKAAVEGFRDDFIRQAKAQGLDVGYNLVNGVISSDSVVLRKDGKETVLDLEQSKDPARDAQFGVFDIGGAGHYVPTA